MPTSRCGKVRRLLREGKAQVVKRCPFTVKLLYCAGSSVQPVSLGIDAGSKTIGVSATTASKELYAAEVALRTDITDLLSTRRELRSSRRNRKTRYRQPRFNNRVHAKNKGWLAPSVEAKIGTHIRVVSDVMKILPVSRIIVEVASFDVQLIKALEHGEKAPEGTDYQQGDQFGFWNIREYVLFRDGHVCRCCKGKSKDCILNVHHVESRKTGGDAPNNLVTLCETCHKAYHAGKIKLPPTIKRGTSFRDAAFMGIMRWSFYNRLRELYPGMVSMTYGYITKNMRIRNSLDKTHAVDARCISGNPLAEPLESVFFQRKVRCHNRRLHRSTILKGGVRKANQAAKEVRGFRLFDKVRYGKVECFVFGRRASGSFNVRLIDGTVLSAGVTFKKLTLLERSKSMLTERSRRFLPMPKDRGIRAKQCDE